MYQSRVHDVEELLDIWHSLQQSAVDSATDGERVFGPAYGPDEVILSSDNMLIEGAVTETVKQCSKFVECFLADRLPSRAEDIPVIIESIHLQNKWTQLLFLKLSID